ncbi:MAG TPA: biotin carboxylase N-terminal domain-containing protein [Actinomycetes bacterium]|nr:biotin carboxylase N-terminal domain-containing protein [Actinomycetes bacterium]
MIERLLVANRGEVASRVMRTCRAMGIATVAVFSDPDAGAPFVAEADEAVPLGGAAPADSYLRADAILDAAERTGAQGVHPGYGFLAENADFARACRKRGLVFVGPPPEAIAAMGDKREARRLATAAGIPVAPGADATGLDRGALLAAAETVGWPLMVKAALGGGGVGMRVVRDPGELPGAVAATHRQAATAFGSDAVLLERYVEAARHVEIQVLGDAHGRVVHLFERECSVQRRHQKLVEEAPSRAVDAGLRRRLGEAAVALAQAVGYVGAGTVEFLLTPAGELLFLEMNTRLQVEHPVTEAVTGLDLVRLQLLVAEGAPLPEEVVGARMAGHAIEARLYAEDPVRGFLPTAGMLHRFRIEERPGLRVDAGVADGSVVGVHYDPLLAKVIAHAHTRREAAGLLAAALAGARLHGPATNRELLVGVLRHPAFLAGDVDTGFLDRHPPAGRLHAVAAALAAQAGRVAAATIHPGIPPGWRNNPSQPQHVVFEGAAGAVSVGYQLGRSGFELAVDGESLRGVRVRSCRPDLVDLEAGGVRRRFEVHRVGDLHFVDSALGHATLRERPRFGEPAEPRPAGSLESPLPGVVRRVAAAPGDLVPAGAVLVVVEAMKTEHHVAAPRAGRVREVLVAEGQEVDAGMVLAVLDEEGAPPPGGASTASGGAGDGRVRLAPGKER